MGDSREQVFRCDFVGESVHVSAHVRAWDATEALSVFLGELERDGVAGAGDIPVVPSRGGPAMKARYTPAPGPRRPAAEPPLGA